MTHPLPDDNPFANPPSRELPEWFLASMRSTLPTRRAGDPVPLLRLQTVQVPQVVPGEHLTDVRIEPSVGGALEILGYTPDGKRVLRMEIDVEYFDPRIVQRIKRWSRIRPRPALSVVRP